MSDIRPGDLVKVRLSAFSLDGDWVKNWASARGIALKVIERYDEGFDVFVFFANAPALYPNHLTTWYAGNLEKIE